MPDIASLVASIDSRLDTLNAEISRLEQARRALEKSTRNGGSGSSAASRQPQTNGTATAKPERPKPNRLDPDRAEPDRAEPDRAEPHGAEPERPEPNGSSARRTRARAPAGSPSRSARRKQAPLHPDDVERALAAAGGGLSASAVAEQASADYQATLRALRELEASGRVRRDGTRRSTRWRVITDEERIAARAAELERLMRGGS
jgi:hypothetical protein